MPNSTDRARTGQRLLPLMQTIAQYKWDLTAVP